MSFGDLIGPAVIAACITAIATAIGWLVNAERARRDEEQRRDEKVRDVLTAILAEVTSNLGHFGSIDLDAHAAVIAENFRTLGDTYTPFVPRDASTIVFDEIIKDIHVLPSDAISPTVAYYKTAKTISHFIDDLKSADYAKRDSATKLRMYLDYLGMIKRAVREGQVASDALKLSLRSRRRINSPAADRAAR